MLLLYSSLDLYNYQSENRFKFLQVVSFAFNRNSLFGTSENYIDAL